jgi:hypothetical protein
MRLWLLMLLLLWVPAATTAASTRHCGYGGFRGLQRETERHADRLIGL